MISFDQFEKVLTKHRIVLSNLQINAVLNDLMPNPQCGFSVGGVNVWGDAKSIKAVCAWHHESTSTLPYFRRLHEESRK